MRAVRMHAGSNHQYCHKILGGDGWSVTYHNIVVFKKAISIIWLHTIETIFIVLFDKDKAAVPPPPIDSGGQSLNPPIITILGLNRCLPIKQGFGGSPSTFKRICEQCQAEYTTRSWY